MVVGSGAVRYWYEEWLGDLKSMVFWMGTVDIGIDILLMTLLERRYPTNARNADFPKRLAYATTDP